MRYTCEAARSAKIIEMAVIVVVFIPYLRRFEEEINDDDDEPDHVRCG